MVAGLPLLLLVTPQELQLPEQQQQRQHCQQQQQQQPPSVGLPQ